MYFSIYNIIYSSEVQLPNPLVYIYLYFPERKIRFYSNNSYTTSIFTRCYYSGASQKQVKIISVRRAMLNHDMKFSVFGPGVQEGVSWEFLNL